MMSQTNFDTRTASVISERMMNKPSEVKRRNAADNKQTIGQSLKRCEAALRDARSEGRAARIGAEARAVGCKKAMVNKLDSVRYGTDSCLWVSS
ncbi:hypothetical protein DIPPA_19405 [Diplonema papillatum]|nr:hypothetical protein DIPPA_19381 [Diplonema papillatum]KAJ9471790.1 hypothetical protein DIPPA_19352 [Diplonema papillatum]KAJ9471792.1 hypothetical protein DIPPA_19405 [Diplonema papillatum]